MGWLLFRYTLTVLAVIVLTAFGAKYIAGKFRLETTTSGGTNSRPSYYWEQ